MVHDEGLIQRHDARFVRIEGDVSQLGLDMALLKTRVERCEEGVANFREFQRKALQHQWWMKGATAAIVAILTIIGWTIDHAVDKVLPAAKILIEYYDKGHPDAQLPKISHHGDPNSAYATDKIGSNESRQP